MNSMKRLPAISTEKRPVPGLHPRWLCCPGVSLRFWLGRLGGKPPFEAPWMVAYIDKQLQVDSTRTQAALAGRPRPAWTSIAGCCCWWKT